MCVYVNGQEYSVIAFIPARGGSKRVPRKNIKLFAGCPLIFWTIQLARNMDVIDRVIVSTEDQEIAAAAAAAGAEVLRRPGILAGDHVSAAEVIRHAVAYLEPVRYHQAILLYLQPTSPLRSEQDVHGCLSLLLNGCDSAATVTDAALHPYQAWRIDCGQLAPFIKGANPWGKPNMPEQAYQLNGAVYAFFVNRFPKTGESILFGRCGAVRMPRERSVDIDDMLDFKRAERIMLGQMRSSLVESKHGIEPAYPDVEGEENVRGS